MAEMRETFEGLTAAGILEAAFEIVGKGLAGGDPEHRTVFALSVHLWGKTVWGTYERWTAFRRSGTKDGQKDGTAYVDSEWKTGLSQVAF